MSTGLIMLGGYLCILMAACIGFSALVHKEPDGNGLRYYKLP